MTSYLPPAAPAPAGAPQKTPTRSRAGRTAVLVFLVVVALCLGGATGGYLLLRGAQPEGSETARQAIDGFLGSVFNDLDPAGAAEFVCPARFDPDEMESLVDAARQAQEGLEDPRATWVVPDRITLTRGRGELQVGLTLSDAGQPVARKRVRVEVVDQRGWWVCGAGPIVND